MPLTLTPLKNIPLIRQGDDLADIVIRAVDQNHISLEREDILVFAQKIISKSEGRAVNLAAVTPSQRAADLAVQIDKDPRLVELILAESREVLRTRPGTIIVEHKLGFVCANAGIDYSNVSSPLREGDREASPRHRGDTSRSEAEGRPGVRDEEWVLLLPKDPDHSAEILRNQIEAKTGIRIGVLIIDSHGRAWRNGTVGMAIGLAGLPGLQDLRGQPDLFGYTLRITQVAAADELAAAASLVMGQAAEGTPVVHVRGFPYPLREGSLRELIRAKALDLFR